MRPTIDEYYLAMLPLVASRGTCPRRQVACILTDDHGRLCATGYNGNAPGLPHCVDVPCPGAEVIGGAREDCEAVHAEESALLQARSSRREPRTAYCSLTPCFGCANLLLSAGITRVVAVRMYRHDDRGVRLLLKAGVELEVVEG
jgi:dCMP deaminase